ncbi:MAG: protein kinase [Deltaproteobacteria bacterium]|nr:protein kinase [Deltaproteobacteria bacterium]
MMQATLCSTYSRSAEVVVHERSGDLAGQSLGHFRIVARLGEGGMGVVYRAVDGRLQRLVALKVLADRFLSDDRNKEILLREARAAAAVNHPNIAAVYDIGEADGVAFIAMELVDGETLRRWLARAPRSWQEIVRAFVQAGRGLAAAHARGIVHRDFKPDNVLVERDGRVCVTDFGVEEILGTPKYQSPEQAAGGAIDARTDQYSFAVALWEALYGAPPHVPSEEPPPGSPVPGTVARVVRRALGRDPSRRWPSMTALVENLDWAARPRAGRIALFAAGAAVVTFAAVGVTVHLMTRPDAPVAPAGLRTRLIVAPIDNAPDGVIPALIAEMASTSLRIDTVSAPELRGLAARLGVDAKDLDAVAAKAAATDPRPVVVVRGALAGAGKLQTLTLHAGRWSGTRTFDDAGTRRAVADLVSELLASMGAAPLAANERDVLSDSLPAIAAWVTGQTASIAGDQKAAEMAYRQAVSIDPELVEARASLGLTLYDENQKAEAITQLERAIAAADRLPARKRLTLLGDYYGIAGRFSESILAYQQLLATWPGDARTQINLTATALDAQSWPLALEVAHVAAHDHPTIEIARRNLVLAELGNERLADAVRDGQSLIAEVPNASGPAVSATVAALALLGKLPEARALAAKVPDDMAPHAVADLALFEGRLADAEAALAGRTDEIDELVLAWTKLREGDKPAALAAAKLAMGDTSMPGAYLAATAAIDAGDPSGAEDKVRTWSIAAETDRRMYAQLLAGDLARAAGDFHGALAAYRAAALLGDAWLVHDRLARAAAAAGDAETAARENAWLAAHRGQGALVANPSLSLLVR